MSEKPKVGGSPKAIPKNMPASGKASSKNSMPRYQAPPPPPPKKK